MRQSWSDERARIRKVLSTKAGAVDSAGVRGRRSSLPREVCIVSVGLREPQGALTTVQKSAEGIVGGGNEPGCRRSHPVEGPNGPREGINGVAIRTYDS